MPKRSPEEALLQERVSPAGPAGLMIREETRSTPDVEQPQRVLVATSPISPFPHIEARLDPDDGRLLVSIGQHGPCVELTPNDWREKTQELLDEYCWYEPYCKWGVGEDCGECTNCRVRAAVLALTPNATPEDHARGRVVGAWHSALTAQLMYLCGRAEALLITPDIT